MNCLSKRGRLILRSCLEDERSPLFCLFIIALWIVGVIVAVFGIWVLGWLTTLIFPMDEKFISDGGYFGIGLLAAPALLILATIICALYERPKETCQCCSGMTIFAVIIASLYLAGILISVPIDNYIVEIPIYDRETNTTLHCGSFSSDPGACGAVGSAIILFFVLIGLCFYSLGSCLWDDWSKRARQAEHFIV